jgi:adenosine deaminase
MEFQPVAHYTSSSGNIYSVINYKRISNTDIFSLVFKKYLHLVDANLADAAIPMSNHSSAICLYHNEIPVAFTVYSILVDTGILWKNFTYVEPDHRKQGLASYLNTVMETVAKNNKCNKIQSHVHINNELMINCNLSAGMTKQYIKFNKDVSS